MEQNGSNLPCEAFRRAELPERAELTLLAADCRNSAQPALRESSDICRVLKPKKVFPNLIREIQEVHDLGDTRTRKSFPFRDIRHLKPGRVLHFRMPLNSPMDRMYMFRSRLFIGIRGLQGKLCHGGRKEQRMGDKRTGAPARERDCDDQGCFKRGSYSATAWGATRRTASRRFARGLRPSFPEQARSIHLRCGEWP